MGKSLSAGLTGLLLLGGCAVGVKHDYAQKSFDLGNATSASVAVGTLDHRPYVVDGRKAQDFVGVSRGGFGNPFDVTTQSGKALASDISSSIVASMRAKGVDAKDVELKPALSPEQASTVLRSAGKQRAVMITLLEWKSDSMVNVGLTYNLDFRVLDKEGRVLTSKQLQSQEKLGAANPFSPGGSTEILDRFGRMMELLFQSPDVAKALQP